MDRANRIVQIEDYIGEQAVERIFKKVRKIEDLHVVNVSSAYYGGGVATLLSSLTTLMNSVGLKTGWRVIQGAPGFFSITKKMHNALQGGRINLSRLKKQIYEQILYRKRGAQPSDQPRHDRNPRPPAPGYDRPLPAPFPVDLAVPHRPLRTRSPALGVPAVLNRALRRCNL